MPAPIKCNLQGVNVDRSLASEVESKLQEGGAVREGASEEVRRARGRLATLQGRLRATLQNQPGEVTEQVPH